MGVFNRLMGIFGLQEEEEVYEVREQDGEEKTPEKGRQSGSNVVSLHTKKNVRLVLVEPRSYDEVQEFADHLRNRRAIVVNLQRMPTEQATRVLDFLSGTIYAVNGNIQKIGSHIFLCTPDNVEVQGSISEVQDDADKNLR
ncbi:cell division protein SepF [Numidum massiliense]|uniref:cell division protein SepF n=1 Tax=Numidum massiliense TaxID=1522315 RepID=UPI0006D575C7|nr:cell division protein SepF [Numidum massiliense]